MLNRVGRMKSWGAAGMVALAVACSGVLLVTASSKGDPSHGEGPAPSLDRPVAQEVPAGVKRGFAVFRRPAQPSDRIPSGRSTPMLGANAGFARRAQVTASGDGVFLVAGNDALCVGTANTGVSACADVGPDATGRFVAVASQFCGAGVPSGRYQLLIAAADGIDHITVERPDGPDAVLPVENNVAVYEGDKNQPAPTALRWSTLDGPQELTGPVPADALGDCLSLPAN